MLTKLTGFWSIRYIIDKVSALLSYSIHCLLLYEWPIFECFKEYVSIFKHWKIKFWAFNIHCGKSPTLITEKFLLEIEKNISIMATWKNKKILQSFDGYRIIRYSILFYTEILMRKFICVFISWVKNKARFFLRHLENYISRCSIYIFF